MFFTANVIIKPYRPDILQFNGTPCGTPCGSPCGSPCGTIPAAPRYRVVAKFVAVRLAPSLEAAFLRRLNQGTKVEMFEWDSSRRSSDGNGAVVMDFAVQADLHWLCLLVVVVMFCLWILFWV